MYNNVRSHKLHARTTKQCNGITAGRKKRRTNNIRLGNKQGVTGMEWAMGVGEAQGEPHVRVAVPIQGIVQGRYKIR